MFDFSFAEIALIVVVAVVFIGPKELPAVVKAVGGAMRTLKGLSRELKQAFDELSEESGVKDVTDDINRNIQMIRGDDGQFYESYTTSHLKKPDDSNAG